MLPNERTQAVLKLLLRYNINFTKNSLANGLSTELCTRVYPAGLDIHLDWLSKAGLISVTSVKVKPALKPKKSKSKLSKREPAIQREAPVTYLIKATCTRNTVLKLATPVIYPCEKTGEETIDIYVDRLHRLKELATFKQ